MSIKIKAYLYDILKAIQEIEDFCQGVTFEEYRNHMLLKRAVERNIEIIGEAVNRIIKIDSNIPISNAREIIGTRNQIIHGYDAVSDQIIWNIAIISIRNLRSEVENLLGE